VPRIALKIDCDTFEGTKIGLPALLRIFDDLHIRASFFFTLGPDRTGRAIRRVFTRKGFLMKMLRSNAVSMYGPKTMLYGTLLPAPMIGQKLKSDIRAVASAGHDVGVHGWDHVRWHDYLDRMTEAQIESDYGRAHRVFEDIFGRTARSSAAPGWHATAASLAVQERHGIDYASDTRGGKPFFPKAGTRVFKFLEIPTTLPTWDESLADPRFADHDNLLNFYKNAVTDTEVHTLHTEVEGGVYAPLFRRQLEMWKAEGFSFLALDELARETRSKNDAVPAGELARVTLPNRSGLVSAASR
jgi:peptidoglycan/xylan/chitin deacetylase (PgdA/CDA1 family)